MDRRITLKINETFIELLRNCYKGHQKAAMLLDDKGLARVEGYIKGMQLDEKVPFLELESGCKVAIHTIAAVNGIFLPTFSEC